MRNGPQHHLRKGEYFTCKYCGEEFYRRPSHVRRGITKTCGKRECISQSAMRENNAFWGKNHSDEMRAVLKQMRASRPKVSRPPGSNRFGPLKGTRKNSPEARAKISERVKADWRNNRDKRLAACAKASETRKMASLNTEPRYRLQFTPMQRRDWIESKCKWCDSTEDLVLDHILPVMAGGNNRRTNCQTLCRACNIWKMCYVDRPLVLSLLDSKGADYNPEYQESVGLLLDDQPSNAGGTTSSDHPLPLQLSVIREP